MERASLYSGLMNRLITKTVDHCTERTLSLFDFESNPTMNSSDGCSQSSPFTPFSVPPQWPGPSFSDFLSHTITETSNLTKKCFNYFLPQPLQPKESEREYHFDIDMPGVKKSDISVDTIGNELSITAKRFQPSYEVQNGVPFKEYSHKVTLPDNADMNGIKAKCEDGVLYVTVPKKEEYIQERKPVPIS